MACNNRVKAPHEMGSNYSFWFIIFSVLIAAASVGSNNAYSWMKYDRFDEIDAIYRSVTEENCHAKSKEQLTMRADVVSQLPVYNQLLSKVWYKNRTSLIHIHNMALNRAFFYSYVLQKMNTSETFSIQPNWVYFYFSVAADVNANPNTLNASAIYFDTDCHYPNWYTTVPFNKTLPLFGPKAYRWDDYQDQDNWLREPTRQVVKAVDFGAGFSMNYTHPKFKMNPCWVTKATSLSLSPCPLSISGNDDGVFAIWSSVVKLDESDIAIDGQALPRIGRKPVACIVERTGRWSRPFTESLYDGGHPPNLYMEVDMHRISILRYQSWLPDTKGNVDSLTKYTYHIGIKASNITGRFIKDTYEAYSFFGPTSPSASEKDPRMLPVQFTAPYFDCGGSNKWVVSAVSPVIDFMPRYSNYTHLRRQRVVAVSVMDTDFVSLDFNPCSVSAGNPGPSYLSGIHRCKSVTLCKHKAGYGFKRAAYTCGCKPGQRFPWYVEQPYQGDDIEVATELEYQTDFSCTPSNYLQVLPVIDNLPGVSIEGGGIITSSGGEETSEQERRRRSLEDNRTTEARAAAELRHSVYSVNNLPASEKDNLEGSWPPPQPTLGVTDASGNATQELSDQKMMRIAENLRLLRETKEPDKTLYLRDGVVTFSINDEAEKVAPKKPVSVDVELMYQRDVEKHRLWKATLKQGNISLTSSMLRESINQIRDRHIERYTTNYDGRRRKRKRAVLFDDQSFDRMMRIFRKKATVTASNCGQLPNHQLYLPGDVTYGVWTQFESEGRTALRLSHFLSVYLQNVLPEENFGNLRGGGRLQVDHMYGEVIANVMGNFKIYSAGVFFDRNKFENLDGSRREFFGPWAFRKRGSFYALDAAGLPSHYVDEDWFMKAKARFTTNFQNVIRYKIRALIRSDPNGTSTVRHEYYPLTYKAASYEQGFWTKPYFRCDGNVDTWVMTYVSPFFGMDPLRKKLEFRGVTTVDVPLTLLEINQCAQTFTDVNAFKNTARCDYLSTTCVPQPGFPFLRGSYRCLCKLGFEYWHADGKFWIEGSLLELEFEKKKAGLFSRFDLLTCRVAMATTPTFSKMYLVLLCIIAYIFRATT